MSYEFNGQTKLAVADFTSIGSATLTDTIGGVNIYKASNGSAHGWHGMYKTAPTAPYTITTCIQFNGMNPDTAFGFVGPGWSDGTKYVFFYIVTNLSVSGSLRVGVGKYTNSTTFSADYQQNDDTYLTGDILWMRIADDNTNRICSVSRDGVNFVQIHSVGRTDFLTATRVGVFINPYNGEESATVCSWLAT